jgi:hypothetical protein
MTDADTNLNRVSPSRDLSRASRSAGLPTRQRPRARGRLDSEPGLHPSHGTIRAHALHVRTDAELEPPPPARSWHARPLRSAPCPGASHDGRRDARSESPRRVPQWTPRWGRAARWADVGPHALSSLHPSPPEAPRPAPRHRRRPPTETPDWLRIRVYHPPAPPPPAPFDGSRLSSCCFACPPPAALPALLLLACPHPSCRTAWRPREKTAPEGPWLPPS